MSTHYGSSPRILEGVQYTGSATLLSVDSTNPVPEPATLLLVGGGCSGCDGDTSASGDGIDQRNKR